MEEKCKCGYELGDFENIDECLVQVKVEAKGEEASPIVNVRFIVY